MLDSTDVRSGFLRERFGELSYLLMDITELSFASGATALGSVNALA
jgi:hypothetical protein